MINTLLLIGIFGVLSLIIGFCVYLYYWIYECLFSINSRVDLLVFKVNKTGDNQLDELQYWFDEIEDIRETLNDIEFEEAPIDANGKCLCDDANKLIDDASKLIDEASEMLDKATNYMSQKINEMKKHKT